MALPKHHLAIFMATVMSLITPATATVHAVAMYMRTGERTPVIGPESVQLTSVGAQQAYYQVRRTLQNYV